MIITKPVVRRWIYATATAALAILGVHGILTTTQITAWTGLAAAITGLAWANTGPGEQPPPPPRHAAD